MNIRNLGTQILLSVLTIGAIYAILYQFDWMTIFNVEETASKTEQRLGDTYYEFFEMQYGEVDDESIYNVVDSILTRICEPNKINRDRIKLHVFDSDQVNAFALPDDHLVVFSGLILEADNPEQVAGVISHEVAHIELNHVMKKLVQEVGMSVLVGSTTGNRGYGTSQEIAQVLSSSAFSRELEEEADRKAVEYLVNAKINPGELADFFFIIANEEIEGMEFFSWISTHPVSEERAEYIVEESQDHTFEIDTLISWNTWTQLQSDIKALD